jgi:hypothetical protein
MRRVLVAAATIAVTLWLSSSALAWTSPFEISPSPSAGDTQANGSELENDGVLRTWWTNNSGLGERRSGVSLVEKSGRARVVRPAALDRFTEKPSNVNPAYAQPVFLADGRAARCAVVANRQLTRARTYLLVYSPTGALVKRALVADQAQDTTSEVRVAPSCQVAAAGPVEVVMFTQETASTERYQGARQVYVSRVLSGTRTSKPVPVLAPGPGQLTFIPGDTDSYAQVSVTPTGWVAVLWAYAHIEKETRRSIVQRWQFRLSWISPTDSVGPAVALDPMQGGRLCSEQSRSCGTIPPIPAVTTTSAQKALIVFGWPRLSSEAVGTTGSVSPRTTATNRGVFTDPEYNAVASGGRRVVVTWGGGYVTPRRCAPIYAARWLQGHWEKPALISTPAGQACGLNPHAYVNDHGLAALVWWRSTSRTQPTGYAEAAFQS